MGMGTGRTMLNPTELSQLAVLRINRGFMECMKARKKLMADEADAKAKKAVDEAAALRGGGCSSGAGARV